jgi:cell fate regulator YaaT (PSP1 superfamily)
VLRRATGRDLAIREQWREKEVEALEAAETYAVDYRIPIKPVSAEFTFNGERLTVLYVCEDRKVNVDRLARRLERQYSIRVDMRRVGPRDHAKLLGGYGACGEPRCCTRFLSDFEPVSIKMAKTQGVSLNPSEITGLCGRLRCCLTYENEAYERACKDMPRRRKRVNTPYGQGKVIDLLPLRDVVVVQIGDRRVEVPTEEVELVTS